jgi:hypothetical protein
MVYKSGRRATQRGEEKAAPVEKVRGEEIRD